jgi:hypothetical protein
METTSPAPHIREATGHEGKPLHPAAGTILQSFFVFCYQQCELHNARHHVRKILALAEM